MNCSRAFALCGCEATERVEVERDTFAEPQLSAIPQTLTSECARQFVLTQAQARAPELMERMRHGALTSKSTPKCQAFLAHAARFGVLPLITCHLAQADQGAGDVLLIAGFVRQRQ